MKKSPSNTQRPSPFAPHARRGVLLLMILSMLVLFVLLGMTFILTASQFKRSASMRARSDRYGDSPQQLAEMAIHQILRDTSAPGSAAYGHSLLRDVYGTEGFRGQITTFTRPTDETLDGQQWILNVAFGQAVGTTNPDNNPQPLENDVDGDGIPNFADYNQTRPLHNPPTATHVDSNDNGIDDAFDISMMGGAALDDLNRNDVVDAAELTESQKTVRRTGFYNGGVLTFTSGNARGHSVRIMRYSVLDELPTGSPDGVADRIEIAIETDGSLTSTLPSLGDRIVVNGRPFNGTGVGYWASSGNLDQAAPMEGYLDNSGTAISVFTALMPNHSVFDFDHWVDSNGVADNDAKLTWTGGMDEGYDVADYQNMAMAFVPANVQRQRFFLLDPVSFNNIMDDGAQKTSTHIIPSFHRPSIIHYLRNQSGAMTPPDWTRYPAEASLRPKGPQNGPLRDPSGALVADPDRLLEPHPFFNGGAKFDPVSGPWDVDNDGNGIPDSIWADFGVPAQLNAHGKLVKPLFAVMCVDLDGRVNVNAAGTLFASADDAAAIGPRGEGYGPAEIRLSAVTTAASDANAMIDSRYAGSGEQADHANPGMGAQPGGFETNDDGSGSMLYKRMLWQTEYNNSIASQNSNPVDPNGRGVWEIDANGQPTATAGLVALEGTNAYQDDPYEVNLNTPNGNDNLFGAGDLEGLLRLYDADGYDVSQRLTDFNINNPNAITTHSFEVSAAPCLPWDELRSTGVGMANSLLELFDAQVVYNGEPPVDPMRPAYYNGIQTLLPFELLQGQKMNLNRLVGNTLDDDSNGIVDEPAEFLATTPQPQGVLELLNDAGQFFDNAAVVNNSTTNGQEIQDLVSSKVIPTQAPLRQMFARHLYCLARVLVNKDAEIDYDGDGLFTAGETEYALAQWAVNIVDFRDADSIMTPFEFDTNIFNGWGVDGDLATPEASERGVVWGCERPELLITETVAWHDRRVEDTDDEGGKVGNGDASNTLDQRIKPSGAFFVEVYNPWSGATDRKPRELYDTTGSQVELNRVSVPGSPVWRLNICDEVNENPDAIDYTDGGVADRMVYCVHPSSLDGSLATPEDFGVGDDAAGMPIDVGGVATGGYGVIGSGAIEHNGRFYSIYPEMAGPAPDSEDPTTHPNVNLQTGNTAGFGTAIINEPKPLSVSEGVDPAYDLPNDVPVDHGSLLGLTPDGNHPHFRIVHLQRLADPTQAYNANTNPYRTIDSAYVDLTVFNSQDSVDDPIVGAALNAHGVHSCQRGDSDDLLYATHPADGSTQSASMASPLNDTLGQRNTGYPVGTQFPWLTWNNRPYTSQYELLNVPRTSSFLLLREFGILNSPPGPTKPAGFPNRNFPHLFDLTSAPDRLQGGAIGLERLLDFVHVPSPFIGAEKWYSDTVFGESGGHAEARSFRKTSNALSRFRDPGKINLNTMTSGAVWRALSAAYRTPVGELYGGSSADPESFWRLGIEGSMRVDSYDGRVKPITNTHLDPTIPTQFKRPFRSTLASDLGPIDEMKDIDTSTGRPTGRSWLMRENPIDNTKPLFLTDSTASGQNHERNAYFFHRGIQRLANMTTNQSNVYAVWITVGYFEVDPWVTLDGTGPTLYHSGVSGYSASRAIVTYDALHPDGYMLGSEAGADTGQVDRHRSFYIIDRSVPVAFEPGRNHNVDDTILLRRHLE